jgi:DNA replication protein DnaC
MLSQPLFDKLRELGLDAMAATLEEQRNDSDVGELAFEERLGLLVDVQWLHHQNRRLSRRLKEAKLRIPGACMEDIDFKGGRGLDRGLFRELATCRWVDEHLNFLVTGATGVGKSYVASALANQACRRGHRALAYRAPILFEDLTLARADGTYKRFLANLSRRRVLVIEDFGLVPMPERARFDLLEILEDRYAARSTIVTSQLPPDAWHDWIDDPTVADAILDRLVHNAYRIALKGASRRKRGGGAA